MQDGPVAAHRRRRESGRAASLAGISGCKGFSCKKGEKARPVGERALSYRQTTHHRPQRPCAEAKDAHGRDAHARALWESLPRQESPGITSSSPSGDQAHHTGPYNAQRLDSKLGQEELDRGVMRHRPAATPGRGRRRRPLRVVMPTTTPLIKVERTKGTAPGHPPRNVFDDARTTPWSLPSREA